MNPKEPKYRNDQHRHIYITDPYTHERVDPIPPGDVSKNAPSFSSAGMQRRAAIEKSWNDRYSNYPPHSYKVPEFKHEITGPVKPGNYTIPGVVYPHSTPLKILLYKNSTVNNTNVPAPVKPSSTPVKKPNANPVTATKKENVVTNPVTQENQNTTKPLEYLPTQIAVPNPLKGDLIPIKEILPVFSKLHPIPVGIDKITDDEVNKYIEELNIPTVFEKSNVTNDIKPIVNTPQVKIENSTLPQLETLQSPAIEQNISTAQPLVTESPTNLPELNPIPAIAPIENIAAQDPIINEPVADNTEIKPIQEIKTDLPPTANLNIEPVTSENISSYKQKLSQVTTAEAAMKLYDELAAIKLPNVDSKSSAEDLLGASKYRNELMTAKEEVWKKYDELEKKETASVSVNQQVNESLPAVKEELASNKEVKIEGDSKAKQDEPKFNLDELYQQTKKYEVDADTPKFTTSYKDLEQRLSQIQQQDRDMPLLTADIRADFTTAADNLYKIQSEDKPRLKSDLLMYNHRLKLAQNAQNKLLTTIHEEIAEKVDPKVLNIYNKRLEAMATATGSFIHVNFYQDAKLQDREYILNNERDYFTNWNIEKELYNIRESFIESGASPDKVDAYLINILKRRIHSGASAGSWGYSLSPINTNMYKELETSSLYYERFLSNTINEPDTKVFLKAYQDLLATGKFLTENPDFKLTPEGAKLKKTKY